MKREDKLLQKKKLLDACIAHQLEVLGQLKEVMKEAQESANEYGAPKDRYDAFRNQLMRRKDMYAQQYQNALDQLEVLKMIDPDKSIDQVSFGAVVITDNQKVFIASGIGKISLGNIDYFVISPKVPYYQAIEGKKEGDSFFFRGREGKIISVF
jgi:hypothetical protein